ncbi:MAG TPA: hypothetical protein VFD70_25720 [Anaerolineae bacterium]|nr:hypothetical protein [Anaerolineae bacterium]
MQLHPHGLRNWGLGAALVAAVFAVWMLFFPDLAISFFAWPVEPRQAQIFIGAGYIFRTGFFLTVALTPAWHRVRWIYWGNLVFTGTLLFATFWNLQRFNWFSPLAHFWIILYVIEPILMIYGAPRDAAAWTDIPTPRGPVSRGMTWMLILEVMILFPFGAILILNPTFADLRWPWALNPLDAQIIAAWFLGWAAWAGTMAFARDWDEIRTGVRVNLLWGAALIATFIAFFSELDFTRVTTYGYVGGTVILTLVMLFFYWRQERASVNT